MFIGRQHEFATGTTGGTDASPPTPADNRTSEALHWDDIFLPRRLILQELLMQFPEEI